MLACAGIAGAAPALAESRFTALRYTQSGTQVEPSAAKLTTTNDRDWQVTISNCVLGLVPDESKWSPSDFQFRQGFEKGFSGADNPSGIALEYDGKAVMAGQVADTSGHPVKCDVKRFYWIALARVPKLPGYMVVVVTATDDFSGTNVEQIGILFQPDAFLDGQAKPASEFGPVTAAIGRAIAK